MSTNQPKYPYFHQQGQSMELRIPLDRQHRKAVLQFIKAIPDDESTLAEFLTESGVGVLDKLTDPDDEGGEAYCDYIDTTPGSRYDILTRLHALGWVNDDVLAEAHKEADSWQQDGCPKCGPWDDLAADIQGAIDKGGRAPEEMSRLQSLLQKIKAEMTQPIAV